MDKSEEKKLLWIVLVDLAQFLNSLSALVDQAIQEIDSEEGEAWEE